MPLVRVRGRVRVMSWPARDMFAVTVDGVVLLNARALEHEDLQDLAKSKGTFVGVPLTARELRTLSENVYDASSETAAFICRRRRKNKKRGL